MNKILMTSSASKVPLLQAIKSALLKLKPSYSVLAGDSNPQALTRYIADSFWVMPATQDANFQELLQGCVARNVRMILPTRDAELIFWAKHTIKLQETGIFVISSPIASIKSCLDKLAFSQLGAQQQLPFIASYSQPDVASITRWVVKERYGSGSKAVGINLDRQAALLHAKQLSNPIFQPFIEGEEISVDAWLDKQHQVKGLVLRRRELVINGESQITSTFHDFAIEQQVQTILEALYLSGPVVLQAIIDTQHNLQIIECNPRFGGASTASIAVGLDSIYWSMQEALGQDIKLLPFIRKPDVTQVRVAQDIYQKV